MSVPTQPTITNLCTEAFNKIGISSPSSAELTRAEDYWLEEVKGDIWTRAGILGNQRLKSLQSVACQITTDGKSRYSVPSDFDEEIKVSFITGTHTGTAQDGGNTSITLEDEEDATESEVVGKYILLTGGTGVSTPGTTYGLRQVTAYDTDTYIATVESAWGTNPDSTTTYRIIDTQTELDEDNMLDVGNLGSLNLQEGTPSGFTKVMENGTTYLVLDKNPDAATYGILYTYYANLMLLDTAGTVHDLLLYNWRATLTMGLSVKCAVSEDDDKYTGVKSEYEKLIKGLLDREMPYGGEFQGFEL